MKKSLRIVLAQLNLHVGDIQGNVKKHIEAANKARDELKADLIVFPELSLCGYPPEDLLYRHAMLDECDQAMKTLQAEIKDIYCLISHPLRRDKQLFNACTLIYNGKCVAEYCKQLLPNYGVFDEVRYFEPGKETCVVPIHGIPVGLLICEDLWEPEPIAVTVAQGAKIILSPNASPFETDKHARRMAALTQRAREQHVPIVYVNMVGGQDEIVFDGDSLVIDAKGELRATAALFKEALLAVDIDVSGNVTTETPPTSLQESDEARIYQALVLGVRDYVEKNGVRGVILGLSGGIDSALTLTIAVDALGKDRVQAIILPSRYTVDYSVADAVALADTLGVKYEILSIEPAFQAFNDTLSKRFATNKPDVTEENIQARCRAVLLMAISNKEGYLVLTTGNRSELAVGYCTLYGDMAGGFAVLKDIYKTMVYRLAKYRNRLGTVIPARTIDRPPTAELAPDQKDEDTLPPYSQLDKILECYLDKEQSLEEITAQGFDKVLVQKIIGFIRRNEYKRRQSAIGPRIHLKSFGKDWRYPVTNGFKG